MCQTRGTSAWRGGGNAVNTNTVAVSNARHHQENALPKELNSSDFNKYARIGAAVKLAELEQEIAALRRAFPGLTSSAATAKAPAAPAAKSVPAAKPTRRRGRKRPMSPAERKAVSERMKKYWAERNKTKS
jgi:hypothetical protein